MIRRLQIFYVFLLVLVSYYFFEARFLDEKLVKRLVFVILTASIFISFPRMLVTGKGLVTAVQLITISIIGSILMAYLSWGQNIFETYLETMPYLLWLFFFYLIWVKFPIKQLENIILIYGGIYVLLYFFQYVQSPLVLFGKPVSGDEYVLSRRGIIRIIFPGSGIFLASILIGINRLTTQKKGRILWIIYTVLGLVIPFLQVTRQFIVGVLLLYIYHFTKGMSILKRVTIAVSTFGVVLVIFLYSQSSIVEGLIEQQKVDSSKGTEYIRILAGEYFLFDFSPNWMSQLLGNGVPAWGSSKYGIFVEQLADRKEYFMSDVGIIAMYSMFGVLSIIGYVSIWIFSFKNPLPKKYQYLKYYLWYLLLTSLTWYSVYHYNFLISTVFVLYIYHRVYTNNTSLERHEYSSGKKQLVKSITSN